ncbi:MAG: hypothetical protein WC536_02615 [Patescibacteria group bacterium]
MTISEFFSKDYLFNPNTPSESRLYVPLIALFGTLIVFAIITKLVRNVEVKKISERFFLSFLTMGVLGFFYLFFRYEELPYLGSRFFLLLILVVLFVWVLIDAIWTLRFMPKYKKEKKIEERYEKYLPKKKRK